MKLSFLVPHRQAKCIFAMLAACMFTSCYQAQMKGYIKTVQSGIAVLPWPKEMESLFGEGDHFITHYGFSGGPKVWNSEVFFDGRYVLTMQVDVNIDYHRNSVVTNVSPPKFYLFEVSSTISNSMGVEGANFSGQWILDEAKWEKLRDAHGNWSAIGIPVKTNQPVPEFDAYVNGVRAPRVRIPH